MSSCARCWPGTPPWPGWFPEQAADLVTWAPDGYDSDHFDVMQANHRIAVALSCDELATLQQAIEQR